MQNLLKALAICFLAVSLVGCGMSKKKDSEDELGIAHGKLKNGNNNGDNAGPVQSFESYCKGLQGVLVIPTICRYPVSKPILVEPPPADFRGIFRKDLPVMRRGWIVEVIGDRNNSGYLYLSNNGTLVPFLPVTDTLKVSRVEEGTPGLVFLAETNFTTPATINIFECKSDQKIFTTCPAPPPR